MRRRDRPHPGGALRAAFAFAFALALVAGVTAAACGPAAPRGATPPGAPAAAAPPPGGPATSPPSSEPVRADGLEGGQGGLPGAGASGEGAAPAARGAGPAAASVAASSWRFRPPWTAASFAGHTAHEDAIVRHLNALRRSLGLKELVPDERLRAAARQHTVEMIQRRYYAHPSPVAAWKTPAQRACHAGYLDSFVSENIGMIAGYPDVALALHESWKNSPGHYRNMADPNVTRIGVGVTSTQRSGMTVWLGTQNFAADPLDLRGIAVATQTRDVLRVTARLQTNGGLTVKAWRGRQFAGEVPAVGSTHTFTADLPWPVTTSERISFALQTGSETPLVCAHVDVGPGGALRPARVTYHPLCRRVVDLSVQGPRIRVRRRVLSGEALAQSAEALGARFFLNRVWGPLLHLVRGRWTRFSVPLPAADEVRFSLVLTRIQKDYLTLDFRRTNPFVCP